MSQYQYPILHWQPEWLSLPCLKSLVIWNEGKREIGIYPSETILIALVYISNPCISFPII